jgi:hypothetical protein
MLIVFLLYEWLQIFIFSRSIFTSPPSSILPQLLVDTDSIASNLSLPRSSSPFYIATSSPAPSLPAPSSHTPRTLLTQLQTQLRSLRIASTNLAHHLTPLSLAYSAFLPLAQSALTAQHQLLRGYESDLWLSGQVQVLGKVLGGVDVKGKGGAAGKKEGKTLRDFVNLRKFEVVKEECEKRHGKIRPPCGCEGYSGKANGPRLLSIAELTERFEREAREGMEALLAESEEVRVTIESLRCVFSFQKWSSVVWSRD